MPGRFILNLSFILKQKKENTTFRFSLIHTSILVVRFFAFLRLSLDYKYNSQLYFSLQQYLFYLTLFSLHCWEEKFLHAIYISKSHAIPELRDNGSWRRQFSLIVRERVQKFEKGSRLVFYIDTSVVRCEDS